MGVHVKRETPKPVVPPIETIRFEGPAERAVVIRDLSQPKAGLKTVEIRDSAGYLACKWAATLGDLRTFGQALIDLADGK